MKKTTNITDAIRALFAGFDDSMILSCFEGVYGELWCDDESSPATAVIVSGDFLYLAGKPAFADEVMAFAKGKPHAVFVPSCEGWFDILNAACGNKLIKVSRYRMHIPESGFDRRRIEQILDSRDVLSIYGCELYPIGEREYAKCLTSDWAYSFVSNFSDYNDFEKHGFGFVIKHLGRIISGTSTYCYYSKGVEVEVSTAPEYRMRGLAKLTAARFVEECIKRGLKPNWDARNMASVKIASRIGFELSEEYTAYEFRQSGLSPALPRNRFDTAAVDTLAEFDDERIAGAVPKLLEWLKNMNYEVAPMISELLVKHFDVTQPHICGILKPEQTDCVWKHNIIQYLLSLSSRLCSEDILSEIIRIADHPTDGEILEEVHLAAEKYLKDHNK